MAYEVLMEQIKTIPQDLLPEIEDYIQFLLYKNRENASKRERKDLSTFFGAVKFTESPLKIQQEMRDDWN